MNHKRSSVYTDFLYIKISEFASAGEDAAPNEDESTQHLSVFHNSQLTMSRYCVGGVEAGISLARCSQGVGQKIFLVFERKV